MRIEETVQIQRSPEDVWAFVVDHRNDQRWCKKVQLVESDGPGRWTVIHKPVPLRPAMSLALEHRQADPPRLLKLREEDDVSVFDIEYRLEAKEGGTRFTQVSEFEFKKQPRLLHTVFARGVARDVRGQLRDLKRILEAS